RRNADSSRERASRLPSDAPRLPGPLARPPRSRPARRAPRSPGRADRAHGVRDAVGTADPGGGPPGAARQPPPHRSGGSAPRARLVRMEFEPPSGPRTLVAELLGRHGNLLFLGPEDRILGLAQPSPSTTRPLRPGVIYAPPPPRAASEAPPRFAPKEGEPFSISRAIEAHYTPLSLEREGREARREARRLVEQARRRAESALEKVEREAARARDADELLRMGELLKTALGRVQRGHAFVEATEYGEGGPRVVRIPLRPELSPKENLERYFKEYRRMVAARARIAERLEELRSARARAEELLARLDAA